MESITFRFKKDRPFGVLLYTSRYNTESAFELLSMIVKYPFYFFKMHSGLKTKAIIQQKFWSSERITHFFHSFLTPLLFHYVFTIDEIKMSGFYLDFEMTFYLENFVFINICHSMLLATCCCFLMDQK